MATRFSDFSDYAPVDSVVRPALRLVESAAENKPMPPSWLIAPAFRGEIATSVHEHQAPYRVTPTASGSAPYRNLRDVPRNN